MITNERQYRITKAQVARFERAIRQQTERDTGKEIHPMLRTAQTDALQSQLADLRAEIRQYESLRSRKRPLKLASFDDIPRVLIQARIAAGLSQKELADRMGLKEQQIQRYEATAYASANLARVSAVARALGIKVRAGTLVCSL